MDLKRFFIYFTVFATVFLSTPLKGENSMLFVYFEDYPPFSWQENGTMRGIYIDIVEEALHKRLGIPVEHRGYPWKRAQRMVKIGEADSYCTTVTPERLEFSLQTQESIIEVNFKIYTAIDNPKIEKLRKVQSLQDLKGFNLVDYSGSGWAMKNLAGHSIHWLQTNDQIWNFLIKKRADATVKNEWTTRYFLQHFEHQEQIVELPQPVNKEPIFFHIFIGKKSPFVKHLGQLDATIRQMREDGTLQRIYDTYR